MLATKPRELNFISRSLSGCSLISTCTVSTHACIGMIKKEAGEQASKYAFLRTVED